MKKLVMLLNEYEKEKIINEWWSVDEDDNYFWRSIENWKIVNRDYDPDAHSFMNEYIISKKFWFIKWLVENDKINRDKFYDENILKWFMTLTKEEKADSIIMNLSIQDEPINFLISILK